MRPASPSSRFPATAPTTIAIRASRNESAGTSTAPSTITSRLTERFPQRSIVSRSPSTCRRSGTGSIPQLGVFSSIKLRSLRWHDPEQVQRVSSQPLGMRHRGVATLAAVGLAFAVAGCGSGGGGGGGGTLFKAQDEQQLGADSLAVTKAVQPPDTPPSPPPVLASQAH